MQETNRNNFVSIAKALGIICMVIGHSGCPNILTKFIYSFHMPLFFICSGYFFKEIYSSADFKSFCIKKVKKLYLPYIKWSLIFLILHNFFLKINVYNVNTYTYHYQPTDYLRQLFRALIMTDYELLIRPFWFIKELLISSILITTISIIRNKIFPNIKDIFLFAIMFLTALLFKSKDLFIPILGECSLITFAAVYFYTGIIFRKFENKIPASRYVTIFSFLLTLIGSSTYTGDIDMRYTTLHNHIPFYILSICGSITLFNISKWLNEVSKTNILYYIGNHTMPILALNLIALKIGNLIKIIIWDMPLETLSSHTVIYDYNHYFWVIYAVIGVTIPLISELIYNIIRQIVKNRLNNIVNSIKSSIFAKKKR